MLKSHGLIIVGGIQFTSPSPICLFPLCSCRYRGGMSKSPYRPVGPGMTAGNMRSLGIRSHDISCWDCGRRVIRDASDIPDETDLVQWEKRLVCAKCGSRRVDCRRH